MHIPRHRPPIWLRLLLSFVVVAAILGWSIVSLIHRPPPPSPGVSYQGPPCRGTDAANEWGCQK